MVPAGVMTDSLLTLLLALAAVWGALALWYQAPGPKLLSVVPWSAFGIACGVLLWEGRLALAVTGFVIAHTGLLVWWSRLTPSNDRPWADDVAQMTRGTVDGHRVTLHNVRDFAWRSATEYTQCWETRSYDLDRLCSLDMIMSYWSRRSIAHTLI